MQTYYLLDSAGYWTGQTKQVEDGVGVPGGYALMPSAPPSLGPGEWAKADGDKWVKTTDDPNPGPALSDLKRAKTQAIRALFAEKVTEGWLYDGLHVEINDGSRANLGGLALTGFLATQNVVPWPDDYARGWVSIEGDRIPLTAAQAIAFAAGAGSYYSALVQKGQDLEDDVTQASTEAELTAIDIFDGWPANS